jgi:phosphoglycolate phosphatase
MLKQILAELNLPTHRAVMVGDSIHDMAMAQAIDMPRIGVTHGAHGREQLSRYQPKAIIDSLPELLTAL